MSKIVLTVVAPETGELQLYDSARPRITKAIMGYDNYSVAFQFNKRVYGNSNGILDNFVGAMGPALKDYEMITEANVAVTVLYDNGATAALSDLKANEREILSARRRYPRCGKAQP